MPTIRRCCIIGCNSNSREKPQLQFFQFPKEENPIHQLWKQACHASLNRILPFKKPVVCALHFHPKCIGGRRLIASAVPALRLEVPSNLKAFEQQAMTEEIEHSRKCAYINAVVYEWLVRANLNPNLRGSITHGMIKDKAEEAKMIIDPDAFVADNRWLNKFRETHLTGFAAKLANNQLKPLGPLLWIPEIVKDLAHLFPPTSADRTFENVPEQYYTYMQQYGEYEEDEEKHDRSLTNSVNNTNSNSNSNSNGGYDHLSNSNISSPHSSISHSPPLNIGQQQFNKRQKLDIKRISTSPQTPTMLNMPITEIIDNDEDDDEVQMITEPIIVQDLTIDDEPNNKSKLYTKDTRTENSMNSNDPKNKGGYTTIINNNTRYVLRLKSNSDNEKTINGDIDKALPSEVATIPSTDSPTIDSPKENFNTDSGYSSSSNSYTTISTSSSSLPDNKELHTYEEALHYLKPLEDFVLFKENFRAIGLLSQLEVILRKGIPIKKNSPAPPTSSTSSSTNAK